MKTSVILGDDLSTGSVFDTVSPEHFLDFGGAPGCLREFCASPDQCFYGCAVIARLAMPAVLRSVNGPAQRGACEIVGGVFERRMVCQNGTCHFGVPVPCRPMERRCVVLAATRRRQADSQHKPKRA
jgi:hypothetical protein